VTQSERRASLFHKFTLLTDTQRVPRVLRASQAMLSSVHVNFKSRLLKVFESLSSIIETDADESQPLIA
jgi:hypothetical protein